MQSDKVVVASNKRAADLGIVPGTVCHEAWRSCHSACPWCLARETLTGNTILRKEIEEDGVSWDVYWVPINSDLFLHYAFDITDRKQAERELKAYAERLELLNRELQEFAFVASHDLREPLRKIQAFGDRLVHKCAATLDEEAKDNVARMIKSAKRMSELLDALLRYSRVSTRGSPFQLTDLQEVLVDAISDLELVIRRVDGMVEIGELPPVEADPIQLRQLFQNLIGNALKYHRTDEKPMVRIHGRVEEKTCRIFIEDNCIGFENKYIDHIFKPFERLHGHGKYEGLGMGLAICRKIVERHRGSITATSIPGKGSTFIVTLPVKQVPERRWTTERE
jgi:light-regulated signal transduction histidine kinase (bacteriophytochrome)